MRVLQRTIGPFIILVVFVTLVFAKPLWLLVFEGIFPDATELWYPRAELYELVLEHLVLVGISSLLSAAVGIGAAVFLTRRIGTPFLPLGERLAVLGQAFPPAAVLALSVPILGFGFYPTIVALFLYGILPVLRNSLAGIKGLDPAVMEAAAGMGMSRLQMLMRIELPLAAPIIAAGIRSSVIINVGTAAIGATIGAGGLGAPIISGLVNQNPAFLLEGAISAAILALLLDSLFGFAARKPQSLS